MILGVAQVISTRHTPNLPARPSAGKRLISFFTTKPLLTPHFSFVYGLHTDNLKTRGMRILF
jgi:hypothetical protein